MNALQQLIADYLRDHPGETFASIARRGGMPRQTVYAIAKRKRPRQTPRLETIRALAKGLETQEQTVRAAVGLASGYSGIERASQDEAMLLEMFRSLDDERREAVLRRARSMLAEVNEERRGRKGR